MDTLEIQVGSAKKLKARIDGPGWLEIDQGDQEISLNLVQALALAEFILANRHEMQSAYRRHCKGIANGRGN